VVPAWKRLATIGSTSFPPAVSLRWNPETSARREKGGLNLFDGTVRTDRGGLGE